MFNSDIKRIAAKGTIYLAGLYLISTVLCALLYGALRRIEIGQFGVLNDIAGGRINADIVISGSSIGQSHYNTRILSEATGLKSFNISVNGSGLGVQLQLVQWYLEKNVKPKILIQNIDLFNGEIESHIYHPFFYLPYLGDNGLYSGLLRVDRHIWLQRYTSIADLIYLNKDFQKQLVQDIIWILRSNGDYLLDGHASNHRDWMGDKKEEEYLREHSQGIHYGISDEYKRYMRELIEECRKRDIQLVLAVSPEKDSLKRLVINRGDILSYYRKLCRENNLWFMDISDCGLSEQKDLWANLTHMKFTGADRFSELVARELINRKRIRTATCDQ